MLLLIINLISKITSMLFLQASHSLNSPNANPAMPDVCKQPFWKSMKIFTYPKRLGFTKLKLWSKFGAFKIKWDNINSNRELKILWQQCIGKWRASFFVTGTLYCLQSRAWHAGPLEPGVGGAFAPSPPPIFAEI